MNTTQYSHVAEWRGTGLQNLLRRFESARGVKTESLCTMQRLFFDKDLMKKRGEDHSILEVYIPHDNCQNLLIRVKCYLFLTKIDYLNLF